MIEHVSNIEDDPAPWHVIRKLNQVIDAVNAIEGSVRLLQNALENTKWPQSSKPTVHRGGDGPLSAMRD